jgi:hypothetical protein
MLLDGRNPRVSFERNRVTAEVQRIPIQVGNDLYRAGRVDFVCIRDDIKARHFGGRIVSQNIRA